MEAVILFVCYPEPVEGLLPSCIGFDKPSMKDLNGTNNKKIIAYSRAEVSDLRVDLLFIK
jgi:hypothetical protein